MKPIDQPFRFTCDFCVVWLILSVPIYFLAQRLDTLHTTWSHWILTVLLSLLATFVFYGPVLLVRQIVRSGSRGWFVVRVALTIVLAVAIFFFSFNILGHGKDIPFLWIFITSGLAGAYLHWRIDK
ncbi:MAG: hypothetical protein ACREFE_02770 [Limisphaerales bacterium]